MAVSLEDCLVIGISSRALFDLDEENRIYEEEGLKAYADYQIAHEDTILTVSYTHLDVYKRQM